MQVHAGPTPALNGTSSQASAPSPTEGAAALRRSLDKPYTDYLRRLVFAETQPSTMLGARLGRLLREHDGKKLDQAMRAFVRAADRVILKKSDAGWASLVQTSSALLTTVAGVRRALRALATEEQADHAVVGRNNDYTSNYMNLLLDQLMVGLEHFIPAHLLEG
jgi:hypothetical protein